MNDLAPFALVTFTSMLFIVDPIAAVPTYLVITPRMRRGSSGNAPLAGPASR
jgi:small neutral amino acid transporter SnatA (MarC family)